MTKRRTNAIAISLAAVACILAAVLVVLIIKYPSKGKIYPHPEVETEVRAFEGTVESAGGRTWKMIQGVAERDDMEYGELRYTVYLPLDYDSEKEYPFLLYLHGGSIGYRRSPSTTPWLKDLKKYSDVIAENIGDCIILAPQAPGTSKSGSTDRNLYWSGLTPRELINGATVDNSDSSPYLRATEKLMSDFFENGIAYSEDTYNVDESRVYVAGHSQGAIGSYTILRDCPGVFAAAIVGAGVGDPDTVDRWKDTPTRILHGTKDPTVLYAAAEEIEKALPKNSKVEIIPLDEDHNIKPDMYTAENFAWMAAQDLDNAKKPYNIAIIAVFAAIVLVGAVEAALLLKKRKKAETSEESSL